MKTILVADDDEDIRAVIGMHLERLNFAFIEAGTGREALEIANSRSIDLIVLDWMMPEMTGIELIEALRLNMRTKDTPVILMSGREELSEGHSMAALGVSACLEKPFDPKELVQKIQQCLR